jgi:phosphoglucomutase
MPDSKLALLAQKGFANIAVDDALKAEALRHLDDWLANDKFTGLLDSGDYQPLLEWMVAEQRFDLLLDSFYQVIPFGTGGRRGPVGIGPNRINPYTIASSVQGHVEYLRRKLSESEELKVVVAYDVREFQDLRAAYPRDVPNPLIGLTSKDLAQIAAAVYCVAGVTVYMLADEPDDFISTPELSFLIRRYGAHGGLNVSASHNHPDDNGGKFYNDQGGQEIPPDDEQMVDIVETITDVTSMPYVQVRAEGLITEITAADRQAYIDLNLALRMKAEPGPAKIVFSGLHGTGINTVGQCLQQMGFEAGKQFFEVEQQKEFRGDFVNVKFRCPNPEVPQSLDLAIAHAKEVVADLVLATDPDADRLGGASKNGDRFEFLNGNEFAVVLTRYRLETLRDAGKLPATPLVIKTQVTTELITRITEAFGGVVIGDLLVGFKYIGNILRQLEETGRFGDIEASLDDFILGTEESHGLLLTPEIRDKDAAGASVVLAELASDLAAEGRTVYDYLIDTYKQYGYHRNFLRSTIMQGAAGSAAIQKIQRLLRETPPQRIGAFRVLSVTDYWNEEEFGPFVSNTDRSGRNLMTYHLEGGIKATIRPSGTEPKNKIYIEMASEPVGADATDAEFQAVRKKVDDQVRDFSNAFLKTMLAMVDIDLPAYALEISDLVSIDSKRHFAEVFTPELERLAASSGSDEELNDWIDSQLNSYGPDARLLIGSAFTTYLAQARAAASTSAVALDRAERVFLSK